MMDLSTKLEIVNQSDVAANDHIMKTVRLQMTVMAWSFWRTEWATIKPEKSLARLLSPIFYMAPLEGLKKTKKRKIDETSGLSNGSLVIRKAVVEANLAIYNTAKAYPQCQGMGTTIVVGLFHNNILSIAHVGDSRLYRLRNNELQQITKDHSLIQELIDRGLYTPEKHMPTHLKIW